MNVSSSVGSLTPSLVETLSSKKETEQLKGGAQEDVGKQFESIFFSMLLKEMRKSMETDGEGGLFAGDKSDTLGGMFDMYISEHLSQANSLGLAQALNSYHSNQREGGGDEVEESSNSRQAAPIS